MTSDSHRLPRHTSANPLLTTSDMPRSLPPPVGYGSRPCSRGESLQDMTSPCVATRCSGSTSNRSEQAVEDSPTVTYIPRADIVLESSVVKFVVPLDPLRRTLDHSPWHQMLHCPSSTIPRTAVGSASAPWPALRPRRPSASSPKVNFPRGASQDKREKVTGKFYASLTDLGMYLIFSVEQTACSNLGPLRCVFI